MGQEVPGDSVGDEFKGYIFKITGGNDKQGFPMKQGVMHPARVRLLLSEGHSCYRPRRSGERKRKSVRGCIVGMDLAVLALSIIKQGDQEIPGLTDIVHPKRLGPKRATKIRRFFGLSKEDDVSPIKCPRRCDLMIETMLIIQQCRCASLLFVERFNRKVKERNRIRKHQKFNDLLHLRDYNISATG